LDLVRRAAAQEGACRQQGKHDGRQRVPRGQDCTHPTAVPVPLALDEPAAQVALEWQIANLRQLFDSSKGDAKSKCIKSQVFGDGCWQVYFYPNVRLCCRPEYDHLAYAARNDQSGHEQYCSLYLSCEPTPEERERGPLGNNNGSGGQQGWYREGKFKFSFEVGIISPVTLLYIWLTLLSAPRSGRFPIGSLTRQGPSTIACHCCPDIAQKAMEANDHAFSHEARNWGWAQFWKRQDAYYNNVAVKAAVRFSSIQLPQTRPLQGKAYLLRGKG
jgi:hypothetical protein